MSATAKTTTSLVVGATGATGRYVVAYLLQKGQNVRTIVRSKEHLLSSLNEIEPNASSTYEKQLQITESAILDLPDEEIQKQVHGCDSVVQCLGHNITFKGMYGNPRCLVTDSAARLTSAIESANENANGSTKTKFLMMGSDGVANPAGTDDIRPCKERFLLAIIRGLVPPHRDNEGAALYLHKDVAQKVEWTVVRPTDLVNGDAGKFVIYDNPKGGLFGDNVTTRANVAQFMVDLILDDSLFGEHKYKMPVIHDA